MNDINITVNLAQEDRIRVDRLIGLLEGLTVAAQSANLIEPKVVEEVIYEPETEAEMPQEAPQEVVEEQTPPAPEIAQDKPTVTKQDIQQKVITLVGKGKKAEVKDIITTYADSVSALPDDTLTEVWDKLTALEG